MLLNELLTINTTKGIAVTVQSLSSAAGVSDVFVQKSAVRAKALLTQPCYCILFDSLPTVLKDLSVRYKNAFTAALWDEMTLSQPVQQSDTEVLEMSVEEATRRVAVSSDHKHH